MAGFFLFCQLSMNIAFLILEVFKEREREVAVIADGDKVSYIFSIYPTPRLLTFARLVRYTPPQYSCNLPTN